MAVGADLGHQGRDLGEGRAIGRDVEELRADMDGEAPGLDPRHPGGAAVDLAHLAELDAEFILCLAGGDLLMGAGIDVGIDAERDPGALAPVPRHAVEEFQLRQGFRR